MKGIDTCKGIRNCLCVLFFVTGMLSCRSEPDTTREEETQQPVTVSDEITENDEWDYENTNWEEFSDNECQSNVQSPINIIAEDVIPARLEEIQYDYSPFPMEIVDNGHTVQVYGADNSYITVEDKRYQFKQFHFHSPAEHTINGKRYPLEMHLVHKEDGTDNLAVLAMLIDQADTANAFLERVFINVPTEKEVAVQTNIQLTLSDYIPPTQEHYTYMGSLTTPPCTVGVDWIVFKEPIGASKEQINSFTKLYSYNVRPLQPLNNRKVLESLD